jgi:hypothetical protein
VNDGDLNPPWKELASIDDPRLFRFELPRNDGCFFCWEVAQRATCDAYFMMQDADDWATPTRAATLLEILLRDRADLAVCAQPQFAELPDGTSFQVAMRWDRLLHKPTTEKFVVQRALTEEFLYRAPHHGLVRVAALRRVGGYYGGFRIGWDTLLTNLILMTGSITWTPEPLYYRLVRVDSLTHSAETGTKSEYARIVSRCLRRLYDDCYGFYKRSRAGEIDRNRLVQGIRWASQRYVTQAQALELHKQASRLRQVLATAGSHD